MGMTTDNLQRVIESHLTEIADGLWSGVEVAFVAYGDGNPELDILVLSGQPQDVIDAVSRRMRTAPANMHPDDVAVDRFAAAMKAKLAEARSKGRGGWQDKADCSQQLLSNMLHGHVAKGDPRDVANFCMFLQQRGEAILPASGVADNGRVLTCVYCGHEYPQGTPAAGDSVLTDHIKVCDKHPMRELQQQADRLRNALGQLVGASEVTELKGMEVAIRAAPAPAEDKAAILDAIRALIATAPQVAPAVSGGL